MSNKFKLKKKLVSIALALALAAQPLASFPMNVFAGTGKNGVMEAPLKADVKELEINHKVGTKYIVSKSVAFSDKNVLNGREIQEPGIVYAQEKIGSSTRDVYIIADINGILRAANTAAAYAADAAKAAAAFAAYAADAAAAYAAASSADAAASAASSAAYAAAYAADAADADAAAAYAAADAYDDDAYDAWADSYGTAVDGVVSAIVADYKAATVDEQPKKDWLGAAYAAVKAAKKMSDGKGLDLEAKLKIAYMAYRIAQFTWLYNTKDEDKDAKASDCKGKADALQQMIDKVYADKVGDIEEQAAKVTPPQGGVG